MDPTKYKTISGSTTFEYRYYFQVPDVSLSPPKPTILFLHGFPSVASDWVNCVTHFTGKGYGVVVPDMLGYGGSSKPSDPSAYGGVVQAQDFIKILDKEGIEKVFVVGHDWGCRVTSRLANLFPQRHLGTVFIAVGYTAPAPDGLQTIATVKQEFGRDIFGYWKFFNEDDSPEIISQRIDSFFSILYTSNPDLWRNNFAPEGELKKWLIADQRAHIPDWAPNKAEFEKIFKEGGWKAPTNWYRCIVRDAWGQQEKELAETTQQISYPVLQVTTTRDQIAIPALAISQTAPVCSNLTTKPIDTSHWPMFEKPAELNAILEAFFNGI
ncbi:hypothetical protein M422DRAFT_23372 [Sphaerobolus stellatus SS14]|nr:hypothetical protein M422DRAFT_23372 [Sphaerobolus stellatus SS14]